MSTKILESRCLARGLIVSDHSLITAFGSLSECELVACWRPYRSPAGGRGSWCSLPAGTHASTPLTARNNSMLRFPDGSQSISLLARDTESSRESVVSQHVMQIKLDGLIKVLAQNLYSNPDVFLRELVQNAHDAISKRVHLAQSGGQAPPPSGVISIRTSRADRTLTIIDNGAGLSEEEVHKYLATIGSSGTDQLRSSLRESDHAKAVELIGQFGIGLLSAFIVSERVEVTTRSSSSNGLRWTSFGGKDYTVEQQDVPSIGTTVTLFLGRDHTRYLETDNLKSIIRTYADIIGIPIYIDGIAAPINEVNAPWHRQYSSSEEESEALYVYWEKRFRKETSLDVWRVDETFTYFEGEAGAARLGKLNGVLGITDRHIPGLETRGIVDVFVARMFIVSGSRDLLPDWARFIQGVIECGDLSPNAARDNVMRNDALIAARQVLGRIVLERLKFLFRSDKGKFKEIMAWHSYQVLAMSILEEHEEFFREIADLIPLPSDTGKLTIPEYLSRSLTPSTPKLFYVSEASSVSQFFMLAESRGLHVIDATDVFCEEFLLRYSRMWPDKFTLERLDTSDSEHIFVPATEEELEKSKTLLSEFRRFPGVVPKLGHFRPTEIPALLTGSTAAEGRDEMESIARNVTLPASLREKVSRYLQNNLEPLALQINLDNPTIGRLSRNSGIRDEITTNAVTSIYNNAVMLHAKNVTAVNIKTMFSVYGRVVDLLLTESERANLLETEVSQLKLDGGLPAVVPSSKKLTSCVTCFVAMPYKVPECESVFRALESVLEDEPYFWNVIRADEETVDSRLWRNVGSQMEQAHCFVANLSGQNANVMIEVGRMEAYQRPILLLNEVGAAMPPSDLRELLYLEYDSRSTTLIDDLRELIARQSGFVKQIGEPYLSFTFLIKTGELHERVCLALSREFLTCQNLLNADPQTTGKSLGINPRVVETAQDLVRDALSRNGKS